MHLPFWLATALLFLVLLYQDKRARRAIVAALASGNLELPYSNLNLETNGA